MMYLVQRCWTRNRGLYDTWDVVLVRQPSPSWRESKTKVLLQMGFECFRQGSTGVVSTGRRVWFLLVRGEKARYWSFTHQLWRPHRVEALPVSVVYFPCSSHLLMPGHQMVRPHSAVVPSPVLLYNRDHCILMGCRLSHSHPLPQTVDFVNLPCSHGIPHTCVSGA